MEIYARLASFAQTWGLLYFVIAFAGVLFYALRPSAAQKFDDASRIPLKED
ncbi:MAG: cbb3-type cytochrome c oxidase subunit 3 [Oxalobacteraceae bacterium]|nr:MAG: cbb3-type cytochrome c oxidase subunit 3 [Oxalobacteraceae bacterium]